MPEIDPSAFASLAFRQHPGAQLPLGAHLRDESGRAVVLGSAFDGRPTILVLEYLRCQNLCSLVLSGTDCGHGAGTASAAART